MNGEDTKDGGSNNGGQSAASYSVSNHILLLQHIPSQPAGSLKNSLHTGIRMTCLASSRQVPTDAQTAAIDQREQRELPAMREECERLRQKNKASMERIIALEEELAQRMAAEAELQQLRGAHTELKENFHALVGSFHQASQMFTCKSK